MGTFHGLEVSKRALFAQQRALYTTGHNISNVNTEGYSRQRANFVSSTPYPPQSFFKPKIPGQMGTGADIGTVQRVRDQFLDFQYRIENSRSSYWAKRSEALSRMENLLNEPTDNGISVTTDRFWQSLQDLVDDPENTGARSVVAQRALALTETYNHMSRSMQSIQMDLKDQIDVSVDNINSLLRQIHSINEQVVKMEPHQLLPNDMYDERDRLIDELSKYVNIKVHYTASSNGSTDMADGLVNIELLDSTGHSFGNGAYLIDVRGAGSLKDAVNELSVEPGIGDYTAVTSIKVAGNHGLEDLDLLDSLGSLSALIESYGYVNRNGEVVGEYPEMLSNLDLMVTQFATAFNEQHAKGIDGEGGEGIESFFVFIGEGPPTAENITINPDILKNPNHIAASLPGEGSQNANNALKLAELFDEPLTDLKDSSVRTFYTLLIGELGVRGQEAGRMVENTGILKAQVNDQRRSVTAVSLDEEMTNLIKFQHAYNAAARNMTALDEMLEKIINGMGIVGR